jgi:hypothetical protein
MPNDIVSNFTLFLYQTVTTVDNPSIAVDHCVSTLNLVISSCYVQYSHVLFFILFTGLWTYLPFLYSCVAFVGVLMLLGKWLLTNCFVLFNIIFVRLVTKGKQYLIVFGIRYHRNLVEYARVFQTTNILYSSFLFRNRLRYCLWADYLWINGSEARYLYMVLVFGPGQYIFKLRNIL